MKKRRHIVVEELGDATARFRSTCYTCTACTVPYAVHMSEIKLMKERITRTMTYSCHSNVDTQLQGRMLGTPLCAAEYALILCNKM